MTNQSLEMPYDKDYTDWSNMELLDKLDDLIEQAKIQLQKSMSLLSLDVSVDDAFADTLEMTEEMEKILPSFTDVNVKLIAIEKILLYAMHFDEVVKQAIKPMEVTE